MRIAKINSFGAKRIDIRISRNAETYFSHKKQINAFREDEWQIAMFSYEKSKTYKTSTKYVPSGNPGITVPCAVYVISSPVIKSVLDEKEIMLYLRVFGLYPCKEIGIIKDAIKENNGADLENEVAITTPVNERPVDEKVKDDES